MSSAEFCLPIIESAKPKRILNVNVPGLPVGAMKGFKWARLAPFGAQGSALNSDGKGNLNFGLVETEYEPDNETDLGVVLNGYTAITLIKGLSPGRLEDSEFGDDVLQGLSLESRPVEFL